MIVFSIISRHFWFFSTQNLMLSLLFLILVALIWQDFHETVLKFQFSTLLFAFFKKVRELVGEIKYAFDLRPIPKNLNIGRQPCLQGLPFLSWTKTMLGISGGLQDNHLPCGLLFGEWLLNPRLDRSGREPWWFWLAGCVIDIGRGAAIPGGNIPAAGIIPLGGNGTPSGNCQYNANMRITETNSSLQLCSCGYAAQGTPIYEIYPIL